MLFSPVVYSVPPSLPPAFFAPIDLTCSLLSRLLSGSWSHFALHQVPKSLGVHKIPGGSEAKDWFAWGRGTNLAVLLGEAF